MVLYGLATHDPKYLTWQPQKISSITCSHHTTTSRHTIYMTIWWPKSEVSPLLLTPPNSVTLRIFFHFPPVGCWATAITTTTHYKWKQHLNCVLNKTEWDPQCFWLLLRIHPLFIQGTKLRGITESEQLDGCCCSLAAGLSYCLSFST